MIYSDIHGSGERGVALAHGGPFNRKSWEKQTLTLAASGFHVLAFDFRGFGTSRGPGQSAPLSVPFRALVRILLPANRDSDFGRTGTLENIGLGGKIMYAIRDGQHRIV